MLLGNPSTATERKHFRRLPSLLIPFQKPPNFAKITAAEQVEQARLDAELRRLDEELAAIEREYPAMVARENERMRREDAEIRRRVFGTKDGDRCT